MEEKRMSKSEIFRANYLKLDRTLILTFLKCIEESGVDLDVEEIARKSEAESKVFRPWVHAKVYEYNLTEEIISNKKAVEIVFDYIYASILPRGGEDCGKKK